MYDFTITVQAATSINRNKIELDDSCLRQVKSYFAKYCNQMWIWITSNIEEWALYDRVYSWKPPVAKSSILDDTKWQDPAIVNMILQLP